MKKRDETCYLKNYSYYIDTNTLDSCILVTFLKSNQGHIYKREVGKIT